MILAGKTKVPGTFSDDRSLPTPFRAATAPRPEILELPPSAHGAIDFAELRRLRLSPDDVLDFSANTNPFGPSPAVRTAIAAAPPDRYPDRDSLALRAALAESLGAPPQHILVGNGASELLWLIALAFVRPGDPVLIVGPTYGEYARSAALMGGRAVARQAREEDGFTPDGREIPRQLMALRPRIAFVCNPNNPTGAVLHAETVAAWARAHEDTLFVVDEAYLPFVPNLRSAFVFSLENVLVLRSMTKDHALAGLRLGYAVGPARLIEPLRRVRPPWSVNALAQAAGVAALRDAAHYERSLSSLAAAKESLCAGLTSMGLAPLPSAAPFFLARVGDGAAFRRALLPHGILVRDCASFGLPAYVRISPRRPEENERLLAVLAKGGAPCPRAC